MLLNCQIKVLYPRRAFCLIKIHQWRSNPNDSIARTTNWRAEYYKNIILTDKIRLGTSMPGLRLTLDLEKINYKKILLYEHLKQ